MIPKLPSRKASSQKAEAARRLPLARSSGLVLAVLIKTVEIDTCFLSIFSFSLFFLSSTAAFFAHSLSRGILLDFSRLPLIGGILRRQDTHLASSTLHLQGFCAAAIPFLCTCHLNPPATTTATACLRRLPWVPHRPPPPPQATLPPIPHTTHHPGSPPKITEWLGPLLFQTLHSRQKTGTPSSCSISTSSNPLSSSASSFLPRLLFFTLLSFGAPWLCIESVVSLFAPFAPDP